jgi:hypothetical protein
VIGICEVLARFKQNGYAVDADMNLGFFLQGLKQFV